MAQRRKLAAILSADVVGYSRLMSGDEKATVDTLKDYRAAIERVIRRHEGRIVNAPGDNILSEFPSAVEAVEAAVEIQKVLDGRNLELAGDRRMQFRIGVNLGDVIEEDDGTLYGDGVNIAARMEALADAGGVCISSAVYDAIEGKVEHGFEFLGDQNVKNIARPVAVYRVRPDIASDRSNQRKSKRKPIGLISTGALAILIVSGIAVWLFQSDITSHEPDQSISGLPVDHGAIVPSGPSIAVMPFEDLGTDTAEDYFAEGLSTDISDRLSLQPSFFVIGRSTMHTYRQKESNPLVVAEELKVRFILDGTVRRQEGRLRVTASLLDADNGNQVWSNSYDRVLEAENIFMVQDEIANQVVATVADSYGIISRLTSKEADKREGVALSSYECVLLGYRYFEEFSIDNYQRTRSCLENAVVEDPNYAEAWGWLAILYAHEHSLQELFATDELDLALEKALDAGERANLADPDNQMAHEGLAAAHWFRHELEEFVVEAEAAIRANPNDAATIANIGFYYAFSGMTERGLPLLRKAMQLSPHHAYWYQFPFFFEAYRKGDYAEALKAARTGHVKGACWGNAFMTAAYAQMDQLDHARRQLTELRECWPGFEDVFWDQWRRWNVPESSIEHLIEGMRKAGAEIPDKVS